MPLPSHSSRFHHPHNSGWGVPTRSTHKRQISMTPVGFEPPSPRKRAAADPRLRPRGPSDR
jgi:hypothetical protein